MSIRKIVDTEKLTIAQKRFDLTRLADMIEEAYKNNGREPSDRAKKSFAPSGIGYGSGQCPRQWFYAFTGGVIREEDADAMGIANMAYGTEAHARLQDMFEKTGLLVEAERKVECQDPPIFGFADAVINWQGEEVVGEFKTTMQESFVSKKAKNQPAGYHLLQVLIYMWVLKLNKGFVAYENKNLQNLLILPVVWNDENRKLIEETIEWMRTVRKNWSDGNLPNRVFTRKSVNCKSCPFTEHCWNGEDGVVDLPALRVPK